MCDYMAESLSKKKKMLKYLPPLWPSPFQNCLLPTLYLRKRKRQTILNQFKVSAILVFWSSNKELLSRVML